MVKQQDGPTVETVDRAELAAGDRQAIGHLHHRVWPTSSSDDPKYDSQPAAVVDWSTSQRPQVHVVRERGVIVAVAMAGPRRIRTLRGELDVLALAGVACLPEHRGKGYGAAVVRAAFDRVDRGDFALSFFQTGIPDFYRKLGCLLIHNPLINSHSTANPQQRPFWEDHAMIYPADFDWPDGEIDTLGPGW